MALYKCNYYYYCCCCCLLLLSLFPPSLSPF